jgi:hypothetical protein
MNTFKITFIKITFILVGIIFFFLIIDTIIIPFFKLELEVNRLVKKILRENNNVKYVKIFGYEDFPPLSEAWCVIVFTSGEYFVLSDIDEKQNKLTLENCNGYGVVMFIRNYIRYPEYRRVTALGPSFYEDLFELPLKNINDFIQFYPKLKNYMDSLELITTEKLQEYGYGGLWEYLEKSGVKVLSNENFGYDYFIGKEPAYNGYLSFEMIHYIRKN